MADPIFEQRPALEISWTDAPDLWGLKLRDQSEDRLQLVTQALGCPLPAEPCTASGGALWIGPGEWLLEGDYEPARERLRAALEGTPVLLLSVGPGLAQVELGGTAAADLLNKGCSLDLHPAAFAAGRCTRTLLAGIGIILLRTASDRFRLYCDASLCGHLQAWLEEAASEFGGFGGQR